MATPASSVWAVALAPPPTKVAPAPLVVTTVKSTVVRDGVAVSVSDGDGQGEGELGAHLGRLAVARAGL